MGYKSETLIPIYMCSAAALNMNDSGNYYFGLPTNAASTTADVYRCYLPRAGTITGATFDIYSTTATGTAENISMYVRLNNTTDYLIATVGTASALRTFTNWAMSIPIAVGDYIEIKITTPAWVTNPEGSRMGGFILLSNG